VAPIERLWYKTAATPACGVGFHGAEDRHRESGSGTVPGSFGPGVRRDTRHANLENGR